MRVRTALLLLLTLGLTLGLGVHPCGAAEEQHPVAEAKAAMPSCHTQTAEKAAQPEEGDHGCCGSEKTSSNHPCPHVCHATALPAVTPPSFLAVQAVTALSIAPVESASAAPARSIDHVPLI